MGGHLLRPARRHLPPRAVHRIQGHPKKDGRRPRRAAPVREPGVRGLRPAADRREGVRGGRRDRDPGPPGRRAGPQGRGRLRRQGPPPACQRRRPRHQPRARGRAVDPLRPQDGRGEVGRAAGARGGRARPRRRQRGQRPRRAWHRREGGARPGEGVRRARGRARERGQDQAQRVSRGAHQQQRRRDPLQVAGDPARGRARHPRPREPEAKAAQPLGRERALHGAGVRRPGQGVRAGGGAQPHRVRRPDRARRREHRGRRGAEGEEGRGLLRRATRASPCARSLSGWPWPGSAGTPSTSRSTIRRWRSRMGARRRS